ncbi:hypothetical protein SCE1572_28030 [Sorangium cellulosum So0157-2]|uniref:Uncharacterized protein n=1 Tax=Sorangium cellulosum So0157-2 TaxID=1254432 RepID=S4Y1E8_SORCE|nr:hypothetical protein SCE1572_28030 [Sorangium cellulosum So0157-2]
MPARVGLLVARRGSAGPLVIATHEATGRRLAVREVEASSEVRAAA